jgi:hypothetical protein
MPHFGIEVLRERWPLAFPVKGEDVRPLAISSTLNANAAMPVSSLTNRAPRFMSKPIQK